MAPQDTPHRGIAYLATGENLEANNSIVGFAWNALRPYWVQWRSIVEEFLTAMDAMRIDDDIEPMFTFVTETLGEPWETERSARDNHYLDCEPMICVAAITTGFVKTATLPATESQQELA